MKSIKFDKNVLNSSIYTPCLLSV